MPLESGTVVTVEPGVYFIPMLVEDAEDAANIATGSTGLGWTPARLRRDPDRGQRAYRRQGHEVITPDVPLPDWHAEAFTQVWGEAEGQADAYSEASASTGVWP